MNDLIDYQYREAIIDHLLGSGTLEISKAKGSGHVTVRFRTDYKITGCEADSQKVYTTTTTSLDRALIKVRNYWCQNADDVTRQRDFERAQSRLLQIERWKACADRLVSNHHMCSGCPGDKHCGIFEKWNEKWRK